MPGTDDRSGRTPGLTVVHVDVREVGTFAGSVESKLQANLRPQANGPVAAACTVVARYRVTDALTAATADEVRRRVLNVRSADPTPATTWAPTEEAP